MTVAVSRGLVLALVVASTVLGLMGTDLVLPAVPFLPALLGGSLPQAQFVLAAYVGGSCIGLLLYGALGDRIATGTLFVGSLLGTAVVSLACTQVTELDTLIALRTLQGAVAAGPAVFAPGIVKALYDEGGAVRAIGLLGSIEALAPALAPLAGTWLIGIGGWRSTFAVLAFLALALAATLGATRRIPQTARRASGSYARLLADPRFLRYALSQALVLGGLLVFVFSMPTVFVHVLGAGLGTFIVMQVCGIVTFMIAANNAGRLAERYGAERLIGFGSGVAAAGMGALLWYGLAGGASAWVAAALFVPVNTGLGLRGPPGFFRAVVAARGDDARGAALTILFILGVTSLGTAAAAPLLAEGITPVAAVGFGCEVLALLCLLALPRLEPAPSADSATSPGGARSPQEIDP